VRVSLAKGPRLTGAYTARDKFDDQLFRNARLKIPEIEMRLVRSGRNVPMAERLLALPPGNPREARHAPKPLLENGNLQLLTPPGFSVPLPGVVGLVPLSVSAPDQMRSRYRAPGFDAGVGQTREIWFIHNHFLFEVMTYKELDSWLNQILATWRFTK
jgi:hypothetical protein